MRRQLGYIEGRQKVVGMVDGVVGNWRMLRITDDKRRRRFSWAIIKGDQKGEDINGRVTQRVG